MSLGGALRLMVLYAHIPFTAAFFLRVHGAELAALAKKKDARRARAERLAPRNKKRSQNS